METVSLSVLLLASIVLILIQPPFGSRTAIGLTVMVLLTGAGFAARVVYNRWTARRARAAAAAAKDKAVTDSIGKGDAAGTTAGAEAPVQPAGGAPDAGAGVPMPLPPGALIVAVPMPAVGAEGAASPLPSPVPQAPLLVSSVPGVGVGAGAGAVELMPVSPPAYVPDATHHDSGTAGGVFQFVAPRPVQPLDSPGVDLPAGGRAGAYMAVPPSPAPSQSTPPRTASALDSGVGVHFNEWAHKSPPTPPPSAPTHGRGSPKIHPEQPAALL
jgi:hypothetical protein